MTKRSSPPGLPSPPSNLVAVAVGGCEVILAWTECGEGALGFRIERATCNSPCIPFVEIGMTGEHISVFRDGSVTPRTTHSYRVLAWNASGGSLPSNEVKVTTPPDDAERSGDKE